MSARALPIALPRPNHERLPHNLTVPLIVALSLGGWWLLWQAGWALVRAVF